MKKTMKIQNSINFKITIMTLIAIAISIGIFSIIIYANFNDLNKKTLRAIDSELKTLSSEYYNNYIFEIADHISDDVNEVNQELLILSKITSKYFDNVDDKMLKALQQNLYYKDELNFNGKWYQNKSIEPATVFVQGYLLDENKQIKEEPKKLLEESILLDLILPAFADQGTKKVQVYFQGGKEKEIVRMAPWKNIGEDVFNVYPELNNTPIWDTFNPGLVEAWESEYEKNKIAGNMNLNIGRVTPPVQDGITGELVLTYAQPVFDKDDGKLIGSVSFDVPIEDVVDKVEKINLGKNGFAFLTQSNGNIFAIPQRGLDLFGLESNENSTKDFDKGYSKLERFFKSSNFENIKNLNSNMENNNDFLNIVIGDENYIIFNENFNVYQSWSIEKGFYDEVWTLGIVIPEKDMLSMYYKTENSTKVHLKDTMLKLVYYMSFVVVILMCCIIYYNRKFTQNLKKLVLATDVIKHKNYDMHLDIKSKDEIGQLATAFNEMTNEIKNNFLKITEQNDKLISEIEEGKRREKMINYLENFDEATNLPNKKALLNYLTNLKVKQNQNQNMVSLIVMGIDEFRKINEAYGYKLGDELIKLIAERINQIFESNLMFKLKGDEFGLIIESKNFNELISQIDRLKEVMEEPYRIRAKHIRITSSMGVSSYPYDSEDALDLYKFALMAMSYTKETSKGGYKFYSHDMNQDARNRLEMISELSQGIEKNEFYLVYQPIVNLKDESWNGVEALIRWDNSKFGMVSPEEFIPIAEESMKIVSIGNWVLKNALRDLKKLHDENKKIYMSINLSVIQLINKNFYRDIKNIVESIGVDPKYIYLEITENLFIEDTSKVRNILNLLKNYGFSISIDDFGTGYSSLAYLKDLPISKLKIDKNFVIDLEEKANQEIINAIIGLSKNLKFKVIAEGIETIEHKEYLISQNCEEGQGYYFSKPVKYEMLEELIHKK